MLSKINELFGVMPDDFHRRVIIGVLMSVIGAIIILLVVLYSVESFGATLVYAQGNVIESTSAVQGITIFLVFLYVLFISSILYYVYLPWRRFR